MGGAVGVIGAWGIDAGVACPGPVVPPASSSRLPINASSGFAGITEAVGVVGGGFPWSLVGADGIVGLGTGTVCGVGAVCGAGLVGACTPRAISTQLEWGGVGFA